MWLKLPTNDMNWGSTTFKGWNSCLRGWPFGKERGKKLVKIKTRNLDRDKNFYNILPQICPSLTYRLTYQSHLLSFFSSSFDSIYAILGLLGAHNYAGNNPFCPLIFTLTPKIEHAQHTHTHHQCAPVWWWRSTLEIADPMTPTGIAETWTWSLSVVEPGRIQIWKAEFRRGWTPLCAKVQTGRLDSAACLVGAECLCWEEDRPGWPMCWCQCAHPSRCGDVHSLHTQKGTFC